MKNFWHDLRCAFRGWRRAPLFWLAAAATLALGIGVTTAVFSVLGGAGFVGLGLGQLLFEMGPLEPAAVVTATAVLASAAFAACLIPARRAAAVDPVEALRLDG